MISGTDFPQTLPPAETLPAGVPVVSRGDRVRVTHLSDMLNYDNGPVDYRAGEAVHGVVRCVEPDGFFELACDSGELRGYFLHDSTLRVERIGGDREE